MKFSVELVKDILMNSTQCFSSEHCQEKYIQKTDIAILMAVVYGGGKFDEKNSMIDLAISKLISFF